MSHEKTAQTFDGVADSGEADRYENQHGDFADQVIEAMTIAAGEKVLDLGCGNGWATRKIAQANAGVQAIGVDSSPGMIRRADEMHSFTIRARYDFCPFEALDFKDGEFDRAFSMEALYYAADLPGTLSEVLRVLKPGGEFDCVMGFYAESPTTEAWKDVMGVPMHFLGEAEWKSAFEQAGFERVETSRVKDRGGPGDPDGFEPSEATPDWATQEARHEAGVLWIKARKPA